jgi:hypothetical protein
MKKSLVLVALALLIGVSVGAQNYAYAPDAAPGAGSNNLWPFNMSATTARYIQILDAKYLPGVPVKFTEVAFTRYASSGPVTFDAQQFQMRMSHTTTPSSLQLSPLTFASHMEPCPIDLIDTAGGFTYATPTQSVWTDIGTTADFGYDGKRNICLEIRFRGQNTANGFACWADGNGSARLVSNLTGIDNYVAKTGSVTWSTQGLKVRLTYVKDNIVIADDTQRIASTTAVVYINGAAGHTLQLAASLGQSPLNLGTCKIFLDLDGVFLYSVLYGAPIFVGYTQVIPASGTTYGKFTLPYLPALIGLCVYHSGITFDKGRITGCGNTDGTLITA